MVIPHGKQTDILKEKHLNSSNGSFARIILLCSHQYNKGRSSLKVKRNKKSRCPMV